MEQEHSTGEANTTAPVDAPEDIDAGAAAGASSSSPGVESVKSGKRVTPLVWQMLSRLGFKRVIARSWGSDSCGACAAAALASGFLVFPSTAADLDAPAVRADGKALLARDNDSTDSGCRHTWTPTLRQLLEQPDYAGTDYEDGLGNATLRCPEAGCGGRCYMSGLCERRPSCGSGKSHNHCVQCPALGKCIGDYREQHCDDCGGHYFGGFIEAYRCHCKGGGKVRDDEDEDGDDDDDDDDSAGGGGGFSVEQALMLAQMLGLTQRGGGGGTAGAAAGGVPAAAGGASKKPRK